MLVDLILWSNKYVGRLNSVKHFVMGNNLLVVNNRHELSTYFSS